VISKEKGPYHFKLNVAVRNKNLDEGAQEGKKTIDAEQRAEIHRIIENQSAIDVKEYPVRGSDGDKMRFIFTILDQKQALSCYNQLSYQKNTITSDRSLAFMIYFLLPGKNLAITML